MSKWFSKGDQLSDSEDSQEEEEKKAPAASKQAAKGKGRFAFDDEEE